MSKSPIYRVGDADRKQAAKREDGQWFYRVRVYANHSGHWGKWIACLNPPPGAWYDPTAGNARLPKD